ncbi:MAG: nucleotidyltransferase domain-containing protein [Candidatus Cloacimonetes bacterium]|nr:nucleotidyltransferase domain-containing protein [Candidatus Cloacimonadota bacterium]MCF7814228.1 nucleotidyltransferase domain-containing protein [Candidatus Cloacimonadota bacterium]MCF7868435.1 nucleotidyltransferase domain-containing protein [Candidatus Cloacimonadota bacterium]MCF7883945.1 nucleotidyltransferase domain-containing protein [Candidatus Cloacimonadota bacterium]
MAPKQIVDLIKSYLTILSDEGIGIEKAFLYGSYSNGTATEDSDIDLLLVTRQSSIVG